MGKRIAGSTLDEHRARMELKRKHRGLELEKREKVRAERHRPRTPEELEEGRQAMLSLGALMAFSGFRKGLGYP